MKEDIILTVEESDNTQWRMTKLSEEQIRYAREFSEKIDITNKVMVLQYGSLPQNKVKIFSESSLLSVPSADMNEISEDITKLIRRQNEFRTAFRRRNTDSQSPKEAFDSFRVIYDRFSASMSETARRLEIHRSSLLRHITRLDVLYDQCMQFIREFDMYIYAGKSRLKSCRETTLKELTEKAARTGFLEDTIAAEDYREACDMFEKKLGDLSVSRALPLQVMTQIKLIQNTDKMTAENLRRLGSDTFTLYRNRILLASGLQKEDRVIDPQLFEETNDDLLSALQAVLRTQKQGMEDQRKGLSLFRNQ
ncbi:MAG: toxic anion resistance protein [Solobacterium sp.]|nr:toxic anion resistance protein [Solobacterium sp.]